MMHRVLCNKFVIFYTCIYKICFYLNQTNILNIQVPELNYCLSKKMFYSIDVSLCSNQAKILSIHVPELF
jgi:hypothetical protein